MEQVIIIVALIMSIVLHEVSHGYMANWLGDPTARLQGRLTPNPIPHIDPLGSVLIPAFLFFSGAGILFGWAKPVPYNPYNLSNQRWGEAMVAFAGPATNILLAFIFAVIIRAADYFAFSESFTLLCGYIVYINLLLAFFNMIPIPPLDGSKVLVAFLPVRAQMKFNEFSGLISQFGFVATFAFIFIFIMLFWGPFSMLVGSVFYFFTGMPFVL